MSSKIKNTLNGMNSRLDPAEEQSTQLENSKAGMVGQR